MNALNNDSAETLRKIYLLHKRVVIFFIGVMSFTVLIGVVGCTLMFILFSALMDTAAQGLSKSAKMTSESLEELESASARFEREMQQLEKNSLPPQSSQTRAKHETARPHPPHPMIPR